MKRKKSIVLKNFAGIDLTFLFFYFTIFKEGTQLAKASLPYVPLNIRGLSEKFVDSLPTTEQEQ